MSTPQEWLKLHGKYEALRAEHARAKMKAMAQAELERDQAWRRRIGDLVARCEIEKRDPSVAELRALGSPEV